MRVIGFGTYDVTRHPRVGILLSGLREQGVEVTDLNVRLGLDTAQRVAMVQRPWLVYRLFFRLIRCWWQLATRSFRQRRGRPVDAVIVGYLGQFDIFLARALFPRTTIVLDQLVFGADTAADRGLGGPTGLRQKALARLDATSVRAADFVIIDTEESRSLLSADQRNKAVVVAVGAGAEWFAAGRARPPADPAAPLRVVFFGLFTPLQGADTISAAIAAIADRGDIQVTMIGTGQDLARARATARVNPNVCWLDWVDSSRLPPVVAAHDVCLGIFGRGPKALRVVPNKVFQGAAAGCAIVTAESAPQRRTLGEHAVFVPPGDPIALARALRGLADDREKVAQLGHAARSLAVRSFQAGTVVQALHARLIESMREQQ